MALSLQTPYFSDWVDWDWQSKHTALTLTEEMRKTHLFNYLPQRGN